MQRFVPPREAPGLIMEEQPLRDGAASREALLVDALPQAVHPVSIRVRVALDFDQSIALVVEEREGSRAADVARAIMGEITLTQFFFQAGRVVVSVEVGVNAPSIANNSFKEPCERRIGRNQSPNGPIG